MSNNQAGQTLIEVIVVITVGLLVVSALTFATLFSLRNAKFSQNQNQATKLAQEGIERVRAERDRNSQILGLSPSLPTSSWGSQNFWDYHISGSGDCGGGILFKFIGNNIGGGITYLSCDPGNYFELHPETDTGTNPFQRGIIINDDWSTYTFQKKATVIVKWRDSTGSHESKLTTFLRKL